MLGALAAAREVRLAFLIKRSVAIKMTKDLLGTPGVEAAAFTRIDAKKWFDVAVEAGLFQLRFRPDSTETTDRLLLSDGLGLASTLAAGVVNNRFVGDVESYEQAKEIEARNGDGIVWRQGIKHDAARLLELTMSEQGLVNGFGDLVDVERDALAPFFKSSDLAKALPPSRWFPLYQHDLSGPLPDLPQRWPKLHGYLRQHTERFAARASSIYRGKPDFMLFGVGPYTLAPFKVAISGFYKEPRFRVLGPDDNARPPIVDDTCYMLPFDTRDEADAMASYLNGPKVQRFLRSVADRTAKRPYTKEILGRIAVPAALVEQQRELEAKLF